MKLSLSSGASPAPDREQFRQGCLHGLRWLFCAWIIACLPAFGLAPAERTLLVLGDSLSAAYGMPHDQGWVALLEQRLAQDEAPVRVVNASISGETTVGGLARLPRLLEQHQPDVVLVELGGNDGLRGFPIRQLRDNLLRMAEMARESGATVVIAGMHIPPNYGRSYTEQFHQSFIDTAAATDALLVPFLLDNVATRAELMQEDGIHPTAEAQPVILDNLWPTLAEALGLNSHHAAP